MGAEAALAASSASTAEMAAVVVFSESVQTDGIFDAEEQKETLLLGFENEILTNRKAYEFDERVSDVRWYIVHSVYSYTEFLIILLCTSTN